MSKDNICRSCIDCGVTNCENEDGEYPKFCPTAALMDDDSGLFDSTLDLYIEDSENNAVAISAAEVECENYCKMTRVEEIAEFARKMGYKKIGIATCVGLISEARTAAKIFRHKGFEVYGVACKVGAVPKIAVGMDLTTEVVGKNMCNPILQAKLLNEAGTQLNVVIGLCVGHDSLFYKYSDALATTLVTKDRVLCHNPVGALYQTNSYYSKLLK